MQETYLYDKLLAYGTSDYYPFHMPGHKREKKDFVNPFAIDITEIDGFDNLHHAEEILKEAQDRAATLYGAASTHYLVNGSTCGLLSAVYACTSQGGTLLMARNCHKAVYHAAYLRELETVYLYPKQENNYGINGGITPLQVADALRKNPKIEAVLLTSPTYDGVVSNIREIAKIVHAYGIPLIVDEAHGAHFGFHPYFPESALRQGADLVIHSLHKTLPSLTQTALLHRNGDLVCEEMVRRYLGIFQTSSPSYVFMAGMDACIRTLQEQGEALFDAYADRLERFYVSMREQRLLRLAVPQCTSENGIYDFDRSKLVLSVKGTAMDGRQLMSRLREQDHLELEMEAGSYALALTSICDTDEGFARLGRALRSIELELEQQEAAGRNSLLQQEAADYVTDNSVICRISQAQNARGRRISLGESAGTVSKEFLYLYPPGIPLLVPGEVISEDLLKRMEDYRNRGYSLQGMEDHTLETIWIME